MENDIFYHEINSVLGPLRESVDQLLRAVADNTNNLDKQNIRAHIGKIASYMSVIDLNVKMSAFESNPSYFDDEQMVPVNLHSHFKRIGKGFKLSYRKENKTFLIYKNSTVGEILLPNVFSVIPYILLDNAFKYSTRESEVDIRFHVFNSSRMNITVESFGPYVSDSEIHMLFDKNARGELAVKSSIPGKGLGLFYAKSICDFCNVDISISSDDRGYAVNGIQQGIFTVTLKI